MEIPASVRTSFLLNYPLFLHVNLPFHHEFYVCVCLLLSYVLFIHFTHYAGARHRLCMIVLAAQPLLGEIIS